MSCNKFFDILLVFASFLQTYYDVYSLHILFLYFFLLQIGLPIYLLPAPLISLYYFYNNLLLYLVSSIHYFNCIIFAHIPKMNSLSIYFNINNSNIIKTHSFLHQIMTTIAKIPSILKTNVFKIPIVTNITYFVLLTSILLKYQLCRILEFFYIFNSCKVLSRETGG